MLRNPAPAIGEAMLMVIAQFLAHVGWSLSPGRSPARLGEPEAEEHDARRRAPQGSRFIQVDPCPRIPRSFFHSYVFWKGRRPPQNAWCGSDFHARRWCG